MATRKVKEKKPVRPSIIKAHSLTTSAVATLDRIAQDASDYIGWTVSGSAIVRALLHYAEQQGNEWQQAAIFSLIESEIHAGTTWGRPTKAKS